MTTEYLPRQDYASSSDDEYLYVLGTPSPNKAPMVTVEVNTIPVRMMIDTGASADIMDETSFNEICECCKINLKPPTKRIFAYGSDSRYSANSQQEFVLHPQVLNPQYTCYRVAMALC